MNTRNYLLSDAIKRAPRGDGEFLVESAQRLGDRVEKCVSYMADSVIMEVTGYTP